MKIKNGRMERNAYEVEAPKTIDWCSLNRENLVQ